MPMRLPSPLRATLNMPLVWQEGAEGTVRVLLHNAGDFALRSVKVAIEAPFALSLERQRDVRIDLLAPGEEREIAFSIRAVAALSSGSLHVAIASANGGGLMLRQPFRIEGHPTPIDAQPGFRLLG